MFPPQAPPIGLSEKGGSESWNCPLLPRALTPGKEAAYPSPISAWNVGGTEGSSSPPLHIPFVAKILNSLLPVSLQVMADSVVALLPLQRTLSVGPSQ